MNLYVVRVLARAFAAFVEFCSATYPHLLPAELDFYQRDKSSGNVSLCSGKIPMGVWSGSENWVPGIDTKREHQQHEAKPARSSQPGSQRISCPGVHVH